MRTGKQYWDFLPWVIGAVVILSGNLAASAFWEILNSWSCWTTENFPLRNLSLIAFFCAMVAVLYLQRGKFFLIHTLAEKAEPRRHLILFLSLLPPKLAAAGGAPEQIALTGNLDNDLKILESHKLGASPVFWSWEMPLRAIRHHLQKLESLTVVCSKESQRQADLFFHICCEYQQLKHLRFYLLAQRHNLPGLLEITPVSLPVIYAYEGWNFEDFHDLQRGFDFLLAEFARRGYPEQEIMIDFTSGQKVTSVVATAMTFNRRIKAEYVQTNEPWDVLSYDVFLTSKDAGGFAKIDNP